MNDTLAYLIAAAVIGVIIMLYFMVPNTSPTGQNKSLFPRRSLGGSYINLDFLNSKNQDDAEAINRARSIYSSGIVLTSEASKSFDACIYCMSDKNTMDKLIGFSNEILMRELRKNMKFDVKENKELFKARNVEFATAKLATDVQLTKFSDNPAQFLSQPLGKENIKDFAKIGGLEELLHCLIMITYADADKLTRYLTIYDNRFLWQKVGYILSHFPNMKLPASFFNTCKANARKNVRYLYEDIKKESPVFDSEWGLYVPKDMMKLLES